MASIGQIIPNDKLYRGWITNPHGGGFAYVDENNKVVVKKGFKTYNEFHTAYVEAAAQYSATSPFLVHMRIRSQGDLGMANTHPFVITPDEGPAGALAHNGTMFTPEGEAAGTAEDKKSDTRVFAEKLGSQLRFEDVRDGRQLLSKAVGYSRVAFLYDNREVVILNETVGMGRWTNGIWYSNGGCELTDFHKHIDYTR